jgi:TetR/AcrR family transcriptional regulator, transcriptional repressor for nem operon
MARLPNIAFEDIVLKARPFFWLKGYHGVTTDELAKHLEISPSVLYKKYDKDMIFIGALESYIDTFTNPFLLGLKDTTEGIETFRKAFYGLANVFIDKTFPRSCMLVNSIVEIHGNSNKQKIAQLYSHFVNSMKASFTIVLEKAYELGEIRDASKIEEYATFLSTTTFELTVLYKCKSKKELRLYIDHQLALLV